MNQYVMLTLIRFLQQSLNVLDVYHYVPINQNLPIAMQLLCM